MSQLMTCLLPDADTMRKRLEAISDDPHLREHLYPLFAKYAGSSKNAFGVTMIVRLTFCEYVTNGRMPNSALKLLMLRADAFIDALVPDVALAKEAKQLFHEMEAATR